MIHHHVDRYVLLHRALGKKFDAQEKSLHQFAAFADERATPYITAGLILEWAGEAPTPNAARIRFDCVRALAKFLHSEDPRHEAPAAGLLGRGRRRRPAPYILMPDQIAGIMAEALRVPGRAPISSLTYHHLFGLLASTGLRISEALSVCCDDLTDDGLLVRSGKFGKSRLVPLHASTRAALEQYLATRREVRGASNDLFVLGHGRAPTTTRAHVVFVRIVRQLGYRNQRGPGPRLHDLRHNSGSRIIPSAGLEGVGFGRFLANQSA
ncbi:MAG: tyrosine-type recombinase/integrase [Aliidongia sp.]